MGPQRHCRNGWVRYSTPSIASPATKYLAAARTDERTWAAARVAGHQMPIASVLELAGRQLRTVT